jgi:hypothetical protein
MKLTTARLKRLIREEIERMNESPIGKYMPMITNGLGPTPGLAKPQTGKSYLVSINPSHHGMHQVHLLRQPYRDYDTKTDAMNHSLSGENYLISTEDMNEFMFKDQTTLPIE